VFCYTFPLYIAPLFSVFFWQAPFHCFSVSRFLYSTVTVSVFFALAMTLSEFESVYRDAIDDLLNQLQTLSLLSSRLQVQLTTNLPQSPDLLPLAADLETRLLSLGDSLQHLSLAVESFINSQTNR
jgi:hypothetical protein